MNGQQFIGKKANEIRLHPEAPQALVVATMGMGDAILESIEFHEDGRIGLVTWKQSRKNNNGIL